MSKIEWTGVTWNPIVGCSLASPGCTNCYAMKFAGTRLQHLPKYDGLTQPSKAGPVWTGKLAFDEKALLEPLGWKKPSTVFVNSMGDLFHEDVTDDQIDRVFAVMVLTPQHTYQVLTKRSARMREYFRESNGWRTRIARLLDGLKPNPLWNGNVYQGWQSLHGKPDGLPNVWLGVSVEDQQRADERIPDLLATPAAIRWISAEPLLEPVNIRAALRPLQPFSEAALPEDWAGFSWPDWVPETVRARVMDFWRREWGRSPRAWLRDAITQGGPALWSEATIRMLNGAGDPISGRFVHLWNNIGAVVMDDGSITHGSFTGSGVYPAVINNGRGIDWVVAGGESGKHARPMHPDWARSLRDQCAAADVPFFFKQWGEYHPADQRKDVDQIQAMGDMGTALRSGAAHAFVDQWTWKIGKKRAGRLLDGILHDAMPGVAR